MCRCLTPAPWSTAAEQREAPFLNASGTDAWRRELFERIDVWQTWITDLGGRTFIEPPCGPRGSGAYNVIFDYGMFLASFESREEAIELVTVMRAAGFDVRMERERRST